MRKDHGTAVPGKDVPFDTFDFTTAVYSEYPEYPEYPEYSEYPGTAVCYYLQLYMRHTKFSTAVV